MYSCLIEHIKHIRYYYVQYIIYNEQKLFKYTINIYVTINFKSQQILQFFDMHNMFITCCVYVCLIFCKCENFKRIIIQYRFRIYKTACNYTYIIGFIVIHILIIQYKVEINILLRISQSFSYFLISLHIRLSHLHHRLTHLLASV